MSRVLVTGGTGFLGAWVVRELVGRGFSPRIFDLSPREENLNFVQEGLSKQVEIISADIRDPDAVDSAMRGCSAVIHLAGLMTRDCAIHPVRAIEVNLTGSQHVFASAGRYGIGPVVYASSGAVYGPADNTSPTPMTLYGTLKLAVEGIARVALEDFGVSSAGFRPYIVYGPGESAGIAAGPSVALRAAACGEAAEIQFSGSVGFVHVCDVAHAMVAALSCVEKMAVKLDMGGEYASVTSFMERVRKLAPLAQLSVSGEPLRMPKTLDGGDRLKWFSGLPITGLDAGIRQTLDHWASPNATKFLAGKQIEIEAVTA